MASPDRLAWILPMLFVVLAAALVVIFDQRTVIVPFIYSLF